MFSGNGSPTPAPEENDTNTESKAGFVLFFLSDYSGRLKVEMFYGEKFESVNVFIQKLHEYIYYYNNDRISLKLKMSPVKYRTQSQYF
ncbi:MAG: IS3 family transposase [Eubacteriales bacterium]